MNTELAENICRTLIRHQIVPNCYYVERHDEFFFRDNSFNNRFAKRLENICYQWFVTPYGDEIRVIFRLDIKEMMEYLHLIEFSKTVDGFMCHVLGYSFKVFTLKESLDDDGFLVRSLITDDMFPTALKEYEDIIINEFIEEYANDSTHMV